MDKPRKSSLVDRYGKPLYEGEIVHYQNNNYVVFFDDGSATKQAPYWRFKREHGNEGFVPNGMDNYPFKVYRGSL